MLKPLSGGQCDDADVPLVVDEGLGVIGMDLNPLEAKLLQKSQLVRDIFIVGVDTAEGDEPVAEGLVDEAGKLRDAVELTRPRAHREDDALVDPRALHTVQNAAERPVGMRLHVRNAPERRHRALGDLIGVDVGMKIYDHEIPSLMLQKNYQLLFFSQPPYFSTSTF